MRRASKNKSKSTQRSAPLTDRPDDIQGRWLVVALAAGTWLLSLPVFEPRSFGLFAAVAFVPWTLAVCLSARGAWTYLVAYLLGSVFFLTHLRWLYTTTGPGYLALALYLAVYFPLAIWPVRHLYRKRGLSPAISLPIAWVAWEFIRSRGPLGFPWFLIGHTQVRRLTLIQIADLGGAFAVTFVVMMINGWLAERVIRAIQIRRGRKPTDSHWASMATAAGLLLVVGGTVLYGRYRLSFQGAEPGPRIAVLQGDYLLSATEDPGAEAQRNARPENDRIDDWIRLGLRVGGDYEADKRLTYLGLINQCASDSPDLMVLPETPWWLYLNRELRELPSTPAFEQMSESEQAFYRFRSELSRLQHEEIASLASRHGSAIAIGALAHEKQPSGSYPAELRFNSAFVYSPNEPEPLRYDKIHLVLFGEYVPFRYSQRLFWLYRFLNDGWWNPWGQGGYEYSLKAGEEYTTFPLTAPSIDDRQVRFAVTICYEDVMPQDFRRFVADDQGRKRVDFMVNISNDGWFGHGSQQAQHLVSCAFRAVENRVAVARAVNTGVSGFINPDGSWYSLVGESSTEPRVGGTGYKVDQIRIDPRVAFYSRHGDIFAMACVLLALVGTLDSWILRWMPGRARAE